MRLVPFAARPSTPARDKSGTVRSDPPPAIALIVPANSPPKKISNAAPRDIAAPYDERWRTPGFALDAVRMPGEDGAMTDDPSISARPAGPLLISGAVPLVRKRAVHSEHGEPLAWKTSEPLTDKETFALCRCGESANKPFCDGTHAANGFEGVDTADTSTYDERSTTLGGTGITVRDDRSICVHAGFCGNRVTNIWKQVADTEDSLVRLAVINEVEKCPSGAITYRFDGDDEDTEPDYPTEISVIEDGPLWVTGRIPVTTSDGRELEVRSRVTLCRCGRSGNKPLCDGSHTEAGFTDG